MKIIVPPIEIKKGDGFKKPEPLGEKNSKYDIFNRGSFAAKLTDLIINTDDELVIALDAAWGEGKTTFVKMWQDMLINEKNGKAIQLKPIYFDAFKNDFLEDPFLALVGEVYSLLDSEKDEDKKIQEKVVSALTFIGKATVNIGVKAAIGGLIDNNAVYDNSGLEKDIAGKLDNYLSARLKSIKEKRTPIEAFQTCLQEIVEETGKIVFIIDELDRCKPSFALALIERIKHIFSVPNIVFVLVMNKEQIDNVVKSRYGITDSSKYLQKFIHIWASLPKNNLKAKEGEIYLEYCLKEMGFKEEQQREVTDENYQPALHYYNAVEETFKELVTHYNMSLRDIERSLTNYAVVHNMINDKSPIAPEQAKLLVYLSIVKVLYASTYKQIKNGTIVSKNLIKNTDLKSFAEVNDKSKNNQGPLLPKDWSSMSLKQLLEYDFSTKQEKQEMRKNKEFLLSPFFNKINDKQGYKIKTKYEEERGITLHMCSWLETFQMNTEN